MPERVKLVHKAIIICSMLPIMNLRCNPNRFFLLVYKTTPVGIVAIKV